MQNGNEGDHYVSCDSKFVLGFMNKLGNTTRSTYRIIGMINNYIIHLGMDITGGHKKN